MKPVKLNPAYSVLFYFNPTIWRIEIQTIDSGPCYWWIDKILNLTISNS